MSGLPIFADPSTSVVYHSVPSASNVGGSGQGVGAGGHSQQQLPPTVAMMVVQNSSQPRHDSLSSMPLPPGMEIVLGDKKYKIQYQSYEMTREKATEYIAKCTGTPYSRMSAPPDPESFYRATGVVGASRSEGVGGLAVASMPMAADPLGVKPAGMPTTLAGDRGTRRMSSTSTVSEDRYQRLKTPDEVYTTITPAAAGLPPEIARGTGVLPQQQQQQQLPKVPEQHQVVTTESTSYQAAPSYAPPPKDSDQQQQNMGYFWEDGVWKVWQADSGKTPVSAPGEATMASRKLPPPLPVQQSQPPQPSYASQLQPERSQYQYQYQYQYPQQQQPQQQPHPPQQSPALVATSTTLDPPSYLTQYSQPQHQSQHQPHQDPQARGPPPQPMGLIQRHASAGSSNVSGAAGIDPMVTRYTI